MDADAAPDLAAASSNAKPSGRRASRALCRVLIVVAVLLVFGRLVTAEFTFWDDHSTIFQNPSFGSPGWHTLTHHWQHPRDHIYIPLTYTVWTLLACVSQVPPDGLGVGFNPLLFHAANVCVHVGSALLVYSLLRRLLHHSMAAAFGALVFALHPVQVESVGWISGLKDVLAGCLALATLLCFVVYRQAGRRRWLVGAMVVFVLAMLSKPAAMTAPLLLVVIDGLLLRTPWRRVAWATAPFFVLAIPIALIARLSQPPPPLYVPLWARPLIASP